jgi:hypothetical protein
LPEKEILNRLWKLDTKICRKYNLPQQYERPPSLAFDPDWSNRIVQQALLHNAVRVSTTWASDVSDDPKNFLAGRLLGPSKLPFPDNPSNPIMTITLDLSKVNPKQPGWLMAWFKDILQIALKELPGAYREGQSIESENVIRDYERYRVHMFQHVSFRWIAVMERTGVTKEDQKPLIGLLVPGESSVRESVCRVYKALFEKPYRARLHKYERRDVRLVSTLKTFECPHHKPDCPLDCRYAQDWVKNNRL